MTLTLNEEMHMTVKYSTFLTKAVLAVASTALLVLPAHAQDTQAQSTFDWNAKADPHAGHNHGPNAADHSAIAVDHVFTEAKGEHAIGDALAPHTLIVYASVVCGHCGRWFSEDYPIIKERLINTGKMRLVFREFPTQPADVAVAGFQIANCAAPDAYFDAIVYQFQNQTETFDRLRMGEGRARFLELSKQAGLETENEMISCFESEEGKARIELAMKRATAGNIDAVPALILDGALMPGLNGAREVLEALGEPIGG